MDLRMPRMDGIEATRRLRERHPDVRVIALTTYADDESVLGALRAGARGYLTKDASERRHPQRDPHRRRRRRGARSRPCSTTWSPRWPATARTPPIAGSVDRAELPDDLTPREAEVLALIAEGLTNAEIAERLFVSPTTVKSHINHLFAKAGLRDRTQAVNYAYRTGIATPPR